VSSTAAVDGPPVRGGRRTPADKYDERRTQLAISALATLGELGYARTSLREIAQNSEFSHGVVHYYFADKFELITHCVRYYKAQCVTRYDGLVAESTTAEELLTRFGDKLVETLTDEVAMHRLWYDLRTQSMFEEQFRPDVLMIDATLEDMIGRVVLRYAELAGRPLVMDVPTIYALLDGVFEKALLGHLTGDEDAGARLRARVLDLLPRLLG
jgi:AcrR family transcriptional regulator